MDALVFTVDGKDINHHACGHDANSTMALMGALAIAKRHQERYLKGGFQPAEETLVGAYQC